MTESEEKSSSSIKARTAWHPLFAELLALHLPAGYKLLSEYHLTRQPQRIDVVIWEEGADEGPYPGLPALMDRLTSINLIEFKSPKDVVNWGDYATLVGYAGQYAAKEKPPDMREVSLFLAIPCWRQGLSDELASWGLVPQKVQEGVHLIEHAPWRCWVLELDLVWKERDNGPFSLVSRDFVENPAKVLEEGALSPYLYAWFSQQLASFRERSHEMPLAHREEFEKKMKEAFTEWLMSQPPSEVFGANFGKYLNKLSVEERLQGLSAEERLQGLSAEERDVLRRLLASDGSDEG